MDRGTVKNADRELVVDHAIRWTSNILTEVLGNHARFIRPSTRERLRDAVNALSEARSTIQQSDRIEPAPKP